MNPIRFFVAGKVEPKPKVKACSRGGHAQMYAPTKRANGDPHPFLCWHALVSAEALKCRPELPIQGPVSVDLHCIFQRPKSHYGTGKNAGVIKKNAAHWHTSKPDRDNCDKAVLDILTQLDYWKDDAQVCHGLITKVYAVEGEVPGAQITIRIMEEIT